MANMGGAKCQLLVWDSEFFGFSIGRVEGSRIEGSDGVEIDRWAAETGARCIYFLAEPDAAVASVAESLGFRLVDVRQTLDVDLCGRKTPSGCLEGVREAALSDTPAVHAAALRCGFSTRFTADPRFPRAKVQEMYAIWTSKLVAGDTSAVFLASGGHDIEGFSTVSDLVPGGCAKLDLIAVLPDYQGKGLGRRLVEAVVRKAVQMGAARSSVVTQGWNVAAQRLYQAHGFQTCDCALWFHKWYGTEGHAA